ncbi:MAG: RNA methyltransferase [Phenylobacterium sp.]|nr:RNA methyltransferase [Phenylobacterium sp.]
MIFAIDDPDDPRLSPYRDVRDRDLAGHGGRFMAEGRVVLEKLVASSPGLVESVLVAAHRVDGLSDLIGALPADVPVFAAEQSAMDAVVGFPIHRGVLAVGRRPQRDVASLLAGLPQQALVVGLVGIANHDNMGGIFRNAAAFGAAGLLLDDTCCDPLYRKSIRVSVGAALTTPFAFAGPAAQMVDSLHHAGFEAIALSPSGLEELHDIRVKGRVAVLFGAEGPGLPSDVLSRLRTVRIAMSGGFDSLNVATASGIVLHALTRR